MEHSLLSIIMLQDEFLNVSMKYYKLAVGSPNVNSIINASRNLPKLTDDRLAVLAIAYHNLGVEFEHLKKQDEALRIYKKALKFSKENLGLSHPLV